MMTRSIRFKLIATYVVLAAVSLAVVTAVVLGVLHRRYLDTYTYVVSTQARLIATMLSTYSAEGAVTHAEMEEMAQQFRWRPDATVRVLELRDPLDGDPALPSPEVAAALSGQPVGRDVRFDAPTGQERVFAAAPVGPPGAPVGVVQVSAPTVWVWRQLQRLLPALGGALLLGLAAAWIVGARLARSLTVPVERLTHAAERLREGHLDETVTISTRDEIGRLGEAFQAMAAQLRETIHGLLAERHKIEAILTSMVDAVVATDGDGRVILLNRAAEDLLGVPRAAALERPAAEFLPPTLAGMLAEAAGRGRVQAAELQNGDRVVEVHCAAIQGSGQVIGAVAVLRDVSELRRSERLRRELTANVSHELRTPLTSIKGFAETLLAGAMRDEAAARRFLEIIDAEADRLVKLVDDLMDLSRLESKGVALDLAPVDLGVLLDETVERLRPVAGGRRLDLGLGPAGTQVLGDRDRLAQVLTNLIENAVKFTPEDGRVGIGWQVRGGEVEVTVQDDGAGIPAEDLPHVFERFYKADRSRTGRRGSGLGLAIARHIVEAHGGRMRIASAEGSGTTVAFSVPALADGEAGAPPAAAGAERAGPSEAYPPR